MKQFQFEYSDVVTFEQELRSFKERCDSEHSTKQIFQIYSETLERERVEEVCHAIERSFPNADYMCCSTSGNIVNCEAGTEIAVIGIVFEHPSTRVKMVQYDLKKESFDRIARKIIRETEYNPWIKAIELFETIEEESTTLLCDALKDIAPHVAIFGGIACSEDITSDESYVITKTGGYSEHALAVIFYGGAEFHAEAIKVAGWKTLGKEFRVTKAEGSILYELDGMPAYEVYRKYLNIKNDENFFYNTLEFPLFYDHNGTIILRTPSASNADGSITMASDIESGSLVQLAYGDPNTILQSVQQDSIKIYEFQPDVIHIFSCAARKTFWNQKEPTYELHPFQEAAPSCGFFTHGEFLRTNGYLNQHNVTLVIAAMREGPKDEEQKVVIQKKEQQTTRLPIASRLANFISVTAKELEEMNEKLATANQRLRMAAIIDGLTGLFNRGEIQRQIQQKIDNVKKETFSVVMLDIDNFKQVNDTYGHQEGDIVIIALANILQGKQNTSMRSVSVGRWGGEEFMMLLSGTDAAVASFVAELIRQCFSNVTFPLARPQTVSLGVTQAREDDTMDTLCERVDAALYKAKKTGKNKVIVG